MSTEIEIKKEKEEDVLIFNLIGDITSFAETELLSNFEVELKEGIKNFLFDFSKVEYINSSGIAIIIQILSKAGKENAKVFCSGLSPHFEKVFEMVGLKKYTKIFKERNEALTALKNA